MRRPGERLRRAAARWCSDKTLRQRIDPVIADLQCEHRAALQQGRRWRARWTRVAASAALSKVLALTTFDAAASVCGRLRQQPPATDWAALRRGFAIALGVAAAIYPWGLLDALGIPAVLVAWLPNIGVGVLAARNLFVARARGATA